MQDLDQLIQEIHRLDKAYRSGNPEVTDKQFDALWNTVKNLDPNNDIFKSPMGGNKLPSLNNYSFERWFNSLEPNTDFVVQPKIDGCAVALVYKYNQLVGAYTRKGKDVLDAMKTISNIPQSISNTFGFDNEIVIRGELYGKGLAPSTSQRLAAGHLRKRCPTGEGLAFCAFQIIDANLGTEFKALDQLMQWKFEVCGHIAITENHLQSVKIIFNSWEDSRIFSKYPTDGIVVKINDHNYQTELDHNGTAPRWAIAVKEWWDDD